MQKKTDGIYFTHGDDGDQKKLVGLKMRINGRLAIAYVKGGKLLEYVYLEEITRQVMTGPIREITI